MTIPIGLVDSVASTCVLEGIVKGIWLVAELSQTGGEKREDSPVGRRINQYWGPEVNE